MRTFVVCFHCDGEGYCYSGPDPDFDRRWRCEECGGTGMVEDEVQPRTFEDMDEEDEAGALMGALGQ